LLEISLPNLELALLPLDSPRRSTGSVWVLVDGDDSFVGKDGFGGVVLVFREKRKEMSARATTRRERKR